MNTRLNEFSPQSKVWVYLSDREFTTEEANEIQHKLDLFSLEWIAHKKDLKSTAFVLHNRFLILVVDESQNPASGCSIDASTRFIKGIEKEHGISLFNRLLVAYKTNNHLDVIPYPEIQSKLDSGEISGDTKMFNNLVDSLKGLKENFEIPISQSWVTNLELRT